MAKPSKQFKDFIITELTALAGKETGEIYSKLFSKMSDKDFEEWMDMFIKDPKSVLNIYMPHTKEGTPQTSVTNNEKIIKKYGGELFTRLRFVYPDGTEEITNEEFFVVDAKVRIVSQTVEKGMSVSEGHRVNELTGQVDAAAKFTMPQIGLYYGMGLTNTLNEYTRFRGGDEGLGLALKQQMAKVGTVSSEDIKHLSTGTVSTTALESLFASIHIKIFDHQ